MQNLKIIQREYESRSTNFVQVCFCFLFSNHVRHVVLFQWKKKTEKHRAAIKFKAAARIARVTHDLSTSVKSTGDVSQTIEEADENAE